MNRQVSSVVRYLTMLRCLPANCLHSQTLSIYYGSCTLFCSLIGLAGLAGCSSPSHGEVQRLKRTIQEVRTSAGELDETIKVLLVFLAKQPPNKALAAMNDPETLYSATVRLVTVIIGWEGVTVRYKRETRTYSLRPRLYSPFNYYTLGGRDLLAEHFFRDDYSSRSHGWTNERLVIADLEMNPIDTEQAPVLTKKRRAMFPTLIKKYATFLKEDYEKWLRES